MGILLVEESYLGKSYLKKMRIQASNHFFLPHMLAGGGGVRRISIFFLGPLVLKHKVTFLYIDTRFKLPALMIFLNY